MTEEKKTNDPKVIELSTGVKLRGKPMPPVVFINLSTKNPPPDMPTFKDKDGTVYVNPDDPNYIEKKKHWETESSRDMLNGMIIFGTVLEEVPKGVEKPSGNDWLELVEVAGMQTKPDNKSWRYLWWVLTVAAPDAEDWSKITEVVGRLSGVPEDDVQDAAKFSEGS